MLTIPYFPGSPGPLVVPLLDEWMIPVPAVAVQLRIGSLEGAPVCLPLQGSGPGPEWSFALDDQDIAPGLYPTSLHLDMGDGESWRFGFDFMLHIKGGC